MSDLDMSEWQQEDDGSWSAVVCPGVPRGNPSYPDGPIYLDIKEDEDWDDSNEDGHPALIWRISISEEEAGFGESTIDSGSASDVDQAKADCWEAVIAFLLGEGFSEGEIVGAR